MASNDPLSASSGQGGAPVATGAPPDAVEGAGKLVPRHLLVPFILLLLCFTAWGAAANLTDVLVGVFRGIFDMSNFQSSLVQFAYYGAYFLLALPAAFITSRFGYKAGVLVGLGLAALGGLLFIPAGQILAYEMFLLALFVLAAGLSILETSANPFVIAMGDEQTATQRLNLAQAFNPDRRQYRRAHGCRADPAGPDPGGEQGHHEPPGTRREPGGRPSRSC
jgi:FHS family L-fucose permease-like MFS transporter